MNLINFRKNIFSQNGEDGIIEEIIKRLELKDLEVCEFGAWDGKHLSNTFNLVKNFNAKAVYIEGDKNKYQDLLKTAKEYPNILPINAFVSHKNDKNSLDNLLSPTFLKKDFDILSIDIDGHDLEVMFHTQNYNPKIVIIEINPSMLPGIKHIHDEKIWGNSFSSTIDVFKKKNYTPILQNKSNMLFINNLYFQKINLPRIFIDCEEKLFDAFGIFRRRKFAIFLQKFLPDLIFKKLKKLKDFIFY
jgi:hypothetical protein